MLGRCSKVGLDHFELSLSKLHTLSFPISRCVSVPLEMRCLKKLNDPNRNVPFILTSFTTSFVRESFQYFLRGVMRFYVVPHESSYEGYYGLIYGIWPASTHTSLDSRAVHHARLISDSTDLLKMKVNLKYISTCSSYRAVNAFLLVYKG